MYFMKIKSLPIKAYRKLKKYTESILSKLEYYVIYKHQKKLKLPNRFIINSSADSNTTSTTSKVVYCFWTGENEMTPNRIRCLNYIKQNVGVEVKLITIDNLEEYILKEAPLHPAYPYLSNVHKSDYLRTYFMHHYGGGYADIKRHDNNWLEAFEKLEKDPNLWIIGYPETNEDAIAISDEGFGLALKKQYHCLIGNGAYISKPYTPLTYSWINNLHKKLDKKELLLKKNPGGIWGDNKGYPLVWSEILGQIFHPLCYYFNEHIAQSKQLRYTKEEYR